MKPIIFNTSMTQAILEGRKTVTRRVVKPQPEGKPVPMAKDSCWPGHFAIHGTPKVIRPPYQTGDILWVRETWAEMPYGFVYRADGEDPDGWDCDDRWRPSIHMPREAARIFLRVTGVHVERLQDCGNMQAKDEGCVSGSQFARVWDSTIKPADRSTFGWEANPWVWVIEFKRIKDKEDHK